MADDRSIRVRLVAEVGSYIAGLSAAGKATTAFGREISGLGNTSTADLQKIGRGAAVMAAGLAAGLGVSVKAAISWESAWAGVTKTVNGSTAEMADLEDGLRNMAKELPASHKQIAAVAEAAGALGIQRGAIEGFTRVMIDLGETTDLTADQAATAMAKIANVMQTPQSQFDRLGATLVDLGNNGASTESQILELAQRIAAAGKIAGLSEADVFAFASTLSSVGVEAEAGGTALSKVFVKIRDSVLDGGEELELFAKVAGVSGERFAEAFRSDPASAISMFISGLGRMNATGQSTTQVFKDLDLADQRLMRAMLSTAGAGGLLNDQLAIARNAWEENTALQTEAAKRYETTAAQLGMLRNQVVDLGIDLGDKLLPAVRGAVDAVGTLVAGFGAMPDAMQTAGVGVGVALTGILGLASAAALLGPKIIAVRNALLAMGGAGKVMLAAVPWLAALAGAIAVVSYVQGENEKATREAEERTKSWAKAIEEAGSVTDAVRKKVAEMVRESAGLARLLKEAGMSAGDFGRVLAGTDEDAERFTDHLHEMVSAGDLSSDSAARLSLMVGRARGEIKQGAEDAETAAGVLGGYERATGKAGAAVDGLGKSAEDAKDAIEALSDALDAQFDPLFGMIEAVNDNRDALKDQVKAARDVKDAQDALNVAIREHGRGSQEARDATEALTEAQLSLDDGNTKAAESALDVHLASIKLAAAVRDGSVSVDDAKATMAEWVAQGLLTAAQAQAVSDKFDTVAVKAEELQGKNVQMALTIDTTQADAALGAIRQQLYDLTLARAIALGPLTDNNADRAIDDLLNTLGYNPNRWGNIYSYAGGGITPAHIATGTRYKYAEPATGGEAFIPRNGDPVRSVGILQRTAGWFGAEVVPKGGSGDININMQAVSDADVSRLGQRLAREMAFQKSATGVH